MGFAVRQVNLKENRPAWMIPDSIRVQPRFTQD
jgi:hypothetical protein